MTPAPLPLPVVTSLVERVAAGEAEWPYVAILTRLALALALGLLIGMERERRGKEAGLRTFGFVCLLGALGASLGDGYAYLVLILTAMLTVFLNLQNLRTHEGTELTTSAAMLITCMVGILCGKGHTLTPAAVMVSVTALLAWKDRLSVISIGLTESELRSALLLAILAIVIYPALPAGAIGPMQLIEPRAAWGTVILIAAIGFVNYVLWKLYGSRGLALAGFLGGLVNSSVTVNELAARLKNRHRQPGIMAATYRGILLATTAMLSRNALLLFLLEPRTLPYAALPFGLMLAGSAAWVVSSFRALQAIEEIRPPEVDLALPFSLWATLKYGTIFLILHVGGILMQKAFGDAGFYAVCVVGGMVSSASAVAAAASLFASGSISSELASAGAVAASITSVLINLPFVLRARHRALTARLGMAMAAISLLGVLGLLLGGRLAQFLSERFAQML
jgi:uncharacterized membrane protein (DUF4010 family)